MLFTRSSVAYSSASNVLNIRPGVPKVSGIFAGATEHSDLVD
jgi:hypothetical protein